VEARGGVVGADGGCGIVDAATGVGLDLRVLGGEPRLHDRGLLHREALEAAARRGQRQRDRALAERAGAQADARRVGEGVAERGPIERERPIAVGLDIGRRAAARGR
jgi:hypothetical protein